MSNAVTPLGGAKTNIGGLTLEDMGLQGMISLRGDLSSKALAKAVKARTGLPTMAVGLITEPAQAEAVLQRGDADLVALARAFLYNPRWGWHAAAALQGQVQASAQYWRCLPREASAIFGPDARIGMR